MSRWFNSLRVEHLVTDTVAEYGGLVLTTGRTIVCQGCKYTMDAVSLAGKCRICGHQILIIHPKYGPIVNRRSS